MTNDLLRRAKDFYHNIKREDARGLYELMADFAQSDRNTIAARLEALSQDTDVDDLVKALLAFCDELRGKRAQ